MLHPLHPRDPRVRPWPYPFLGALSVSNDIEFSRLDFFEALMMFLNTKRTTPFGVGLGLELTSSFFFYSAHPCDLSYFSGSEPRATVSPVARRMEDYLQAGWFDTNHAYGDFDQVGGFRREHALRCYETLARLGLRLQIFTNHGGTDNVQNVGADATYHRGDVLGHEAYHADLMKQNGVRYVWTDSMVSKKDMSLRKRLLPFSHRQRTPVLMDCILQDASRFKGFIRFRSTGANAPNLSSLTYQLQQIDWKTLYATRSTVVIYQHLGVLYRNAHLCHPATIEAVCQRPEVFLAPFYILEREHREGRLWVCGLRRLLNYIEATEEVEVQYNSTSNRYTLVYGETVEQPEIFFQGLTLYIDPDKPVHICYNGHDLPMSHNGPDETGRYSTTVTPRKPEDIW